MKLMLNWINLHSISSHRLVCVFPLLCTLYFQPDFFIFIFFFSFLFNCNFSSTQPWLHVWPLLSTGHHYSQFLLSQESESEPLIKSGFSILFRLPLSCSSYCIEDYIVLNKYSSQLHVNVLWIRHKFSWVNLLQGRRKIKGRSEKRPGETFCIAQ